MRVLFITPGAPGRYGKPVSPPVGIAYLASFIKSHGYDADVMDLRVKGKDYDYLSDIKKINPDLIAISLMTYGYKHSYNMINEIKNMLGKKIIIGGPHVSTTRDSVLGDCVADYAVYGEGEYTLLEFLQGLEPNTIKGLIWRSKDKIVINQPRDPILNLDELSFPDYELFELNDYAQKRIPINTARGCPHRCIYCAVDLVSGKRFRARSPENVVNEIEFWYKKGYENFGFNDDTFTENIPRAIQICDELINRKINIQWDLRTGIRVDRVNRELLTKLKKAGCTFIVFGIESIDPDVLNMMRKDVTFNQIEESVKEAKESGLSVGGFFMIGTPSDSYDKFKKTYQFAKSDLFDEVRFYNTIPYPGTLLYKWIEENGKLLFEPSDYLNSRERWEENPIFETDTFSAHARVRAFNEGEYLVANKLITKVLGKIMGNLFSLPCRIKFIRRFIMNFGFSKVALVVKCLDIKKKITSRDK